MRRPRWGIVGFGRIGSYWGSRALNSELRTSLGVDWGIRTSVEKQKIVRSGKWSKLPAVNFAGVNPDGVDMDGVSLWESDTEMLADPDLELVLLCGPPESRLEQVRRYAGSGKHIISEKPLGSSAEEASEICRIAESNGVRLMVAMPVCRFEPYLRMIECHNGDNSWRMASCHAERVINCWDPAVVGGARGSDTLDDLVVHDSHWVAQLGRPSHVSLSGTAVSGFIVKGQLTLWIPGGPTVSVDFGTVRDEATAFRQRFRADFLGEANAKQRMDFGYTSDDQPFTVYTYGEGLKVETPDVGEISMDAAFDAGLRTAASVLHEGGDIGPMCPQSGRTAMLIGAAARDSLMNHDGAPVEIHYS